VIEGITFGMREQVMIFRQMGIPISQIRASGGGARSNFWRQMQADMYQSPVVTINVAEGAALGAAILAAVGTGAFGSVAEACSEIIRVKEKCTPAKKTAAIYATQYEKYGALYPALKGNFAAMGA
jgi:xylulokinase